MSERPRSPRSTSPTNQQESETTDEQPQEISTPPVVLEEPRHTRSQSPVVVIMNAESETVSNAVTIAVNVEGTGDERNFATSAADNEPQNQESTSLD